MKVALIQLVDEASILSVTLAHCISGETATQLHTLAGNLCCCTAGCIAKVCILVMKCIHAAVCLPFPVCYL